MVWGVRLLMCMVVYPLGLCLTEHGIHLSRNFTSCNFSFTVSMMMHGQTPWTQSQGLCSMSTHLPPRVMKIAPCHVVAAAVQASLLVPQFLISLSVHMEALVSPLYIHMGAQSFLHMGAQFFLHTGVQALVRGGQGIIYIITSRLYRRRNH